jgi:hypothetical protein
MKILFTCAIALAGLGGFASAADVGSISFPGGKGPGAGKHVVLLSGDEEYRSEDVMPMMAKVLSKNLGFKTTVLFSVGADGKIDPNASSSLTNPEALDSADAIVMFLRFRKWPDEAMKHFDAAFQRGVPVVAIRTSTHAFQFPDTSAYKNYNSFGKRVLGEFWLSHWGDHKVEGTRGVIEPDNAKHPILNGVTDVFGDTDVYEAEPPEDAVVLLRGQVLKGLNADDAPADRVKKRVNGSEQNVNDPMMPIAWTRELKNESGKTNKIFCTTMGAATDFQSEGLRRLVANGVFWGLNLPVPEKADVTLPGPYEVIPYGVNIFKKGVAPADHASFEKSR